jgi:hypothetical protein
MKHDFKDCTIIIPIRIDTIQRLENLKLALKFIREYFDTNIIICEQDETSKLSTKDENTKHIFVQSDGLFFKSKCINDVVKTIDTKYFSIYDADVIIPVNQLVETHEKLESGANCVYPYDGTFYNVPRDFYITLFDFLDLSVLEGHSFSKGLGMQEITPDRQSFGGCVFFNTVKFKEYGMMNENIMCYGPEDIEVAVRFRTLEGLTRIEGPLYHIDHIRSPNSQENHQYVEKNHQEYRKVFTMDKNSLLEYIKTWTWKNV